MVSQWRRCRWIDKLTHTIDGRSLPYWGNRKNYRKLSTYAPPFFWCCLLSFDKIYVRLDTINGHLAHSKSNKIKLDSNETLQIGLTNESCHREDVRSWWDLDPVASGSRKYEQTANKVTLFVVPFLFEREFVKELFTQIPIIFRTSAPSNVSYIIYRLPFSWNMPAGISCVSWNSLIKGGYGVE
jgi:hypothetical protein